MRNCILAALAASVAGPALAASTGHVCTRGADSRLIEVITPGIVGAACDLKYVRDQGQNISVPYHADNSPDFCAARARSLVRSLEDGGFVCAERQSVEDPADIVEASAPQTDGVPADDAALQVSAIRHEAIDETLALTTGEAAPVKTASGGPTALGVSQASFDGRIRPAGSAVGRIKGAEPVEVSEERLAPVASQPAENKGQADFATPAPAPVAIKPRKPEDVIRNVLAAQAAAWNDGDLDAFMGGYWKSPEMRFVSGGQVINGWNQAYKQYRDNYGEDAGLGRLSLDNPEVRMISDDVAVVVGRFELMKQSQQSSGMFTLVMKRFDGKWRIVHDHTVADALCAE